MNRYTRPRGPWRPVGVPYYLDAQRERLGVSDRITEHPRVKDNRQLSKIGGLTVEVCTNYFGAPRQGDDRTFADWQLKAVRETLGHCEDEIAKTHAIAAAAVAMTDEAYGAFGIEPPVRNFSVVVAGEASAESVEVARLTAERDDLAKALESSRAQIEAITVDRREIINTADSEMTELRAENQRLAAENAALTEQLTRPDSPHHRRTPAKG